MFPDSGALEGGAGISLEGSTGGGVWILGGRMGSIDGARGGDRVGRFPVIDIGTLSSDGDGSFSGVPLNKNSPCSVDGMLQPIPDKGTGFGVKVGESRCDMLSGREGKSRPAVNMLSGKVTGGRTFPNSNSAFGAGT